MPRRYTIEFSEQVGRLHFESISEDQHLDIRDRLAGGESFSINLTELREQLPALRNARMLLDRLSGLINSFLVEVEAKPPKKP